MKNNLRLFSVCILILAFPLTAAAGLEVLPPTHDFGDIEVGASSSTIVTVMNVGYEEEYLSLSISGSADFAITSSVPATISPGSNVFVQITFTPSAEALATGTLVTNGIDTTMLTGQGVAVEPPPSNTVAEILAFFDESVAAGTLYGDGPGSSADGRRGALRNKIKAAGDLLESGENACGQLLDAHQRCDGLPRPPDFVAGPAAGTLAEMILTLMGNLGCE